MIVFLTTADTEILALSGIRELPVALRAANATSPDVLNIAEQASTALIVRLLGGRRTIGANFEALRDSCLRRGVPFVACAGDAIPDPELTELSTVPAEHVRQVFTYLSHGGAENLRNMLLFVAGEPAAEPVELAWFGRYEWPSTATAPPGMPTVAVLFYRAHWMSGNTAFIDLLCERLEAHGCRALPLFVYSLKPDNAAQLEPLLKEGGADLIINTMSFATGSVEWLTSLDLPFLQAIVSTSSRVEWQDAQGGLSPIDAAMNVALPEFDGSIITVPVSFKEEVPAQSELGTPLLRYVPDPERVDLLARLARNWARLRKLPNSDRRVAFVLSNYPTRNARIGNAVGLDTPASLLAVLQAMQASGYSIHGLPESGDELVQAIISRCSNDREFLTEQQLREAAGHLSGTEYSAWFETLPQALRSEMREAWGKPPGNVFRTEDKLAIAGLQFGNVFVGVQPPRGFGENPIAIYHAPDLPPTHHYLAYYRWLREVFRADAIVHVGKHGTLEWLPGKALGLSDACYPDVAIADLPHFYPFIINNPGEGAQA
ncbi:MAG: cobaltochelatase subunit CobN, partial [Chloroflexi bacterium]|nr:cobaltochelatase subunit CobN [Chloroflexota bacterium]